MAHNIMNIDRAINAGDITFYTDGTFNIAKKEIYLLGVRIGKRCDGTATVGFSVNPSESEDAMGFSVNPSESEDAIRGAGILLFLSFSRFAGMP